MKSPKYMKDFTSAVQGAIANYEEGLVSEQELASWIHNLSVGISTNLIDRYQKRLIHLQDDINVLVDVVRDS